MFLVTEVYAGAIGKTSAVQQKAEMCFVAENPHYPTISTEEVIPGNEKKHEGVVTEIPDHIIIKFAVVETAKTPLLEI